ncbi:replication initiator [Kitasatospora purpeofusca]|uniref:FtsK domain-containing protein n=1 Tax=Kitasatospora purpeofusca TaxID=67352 RepID=A0ABZ1U4S4_9ACTN|nr:replication initiator [Kitasatospora purpeofusca]
MVLILLSAAPGLRRNHPYVWWCLLGYPVGAMRIRVTWRRLTTNLGLAVAKRAGQALIGDMVVRGDPLRSVPPHLGIPKLKRGGLDVAVRLYPGQVPEHSVSAIDLKAGMELSLFEDRLSALASTRAEASRLLAELVAETEARMQLCRSVGARSVWDLPPKLRKMPVVLIVDEVAELYLVATRDDKAEVGEISTNLLRLAQLGAALGVYLVIAGQRVGSDLGPGVTALRAQLAGRVCHRVSDPGTAEMVLGDLDKEALEAAQRITLAERAWKRPEPSTAGWSPWQRSGPCPSARTSGPSSPLPGASADWPNFSTSGLRAWAHVVGYRGHCLTRTMAFSITYGKLRAARAEHARDLYADWDSETAVESAWCFAGTGHTRRKRSSLPASPKTSPPTGSSPVRTSTVLIGPGEERDGPPRRPRSGVGSTGGRTGVGAAKVESGPDHRERGRHCGRRRP